jgi:Leucine-rich repeat (LRR) protein
MGQAQAKGASSDERIEQARKTGRLILHSLSPSKGVPAKVWTLQNLRSLNLANNKLTWLPSQIGSLLKLQTLTLSHNALESLPDELHHLLDLRTLAIDHNKLTTLESVLPQRSLRQLITNNNCFSGEIGHPHVGLPSSVQMADLSHNQITALGSTFGFEALPELEELVLDNNLLEELPAALALLPKLVCLKVRHNRLSSVPGELLADGPMLARLELDGNPMTKAQIMRTPGFEVFDERRKQRISKGISAGIHEDLNLCGLAN